MFSKALFRQIVNQTRGVASSKSVSVRSFFKVVGQQQRAANMMVMSQRAFASNTAAIEKSIQKLTKSLEKEIKYESENYSQLDDIETYLNESGFTFSEQENGIVLTLSKTVGDKLVEIQFEAR